MIHRVIKNKDNPYFQLNRAVLEDGRLSWKAVAILVYLLSKPDNWIVRESDLINKHTDGRDAVRSGMAELRDAGYIIKVTIREAGKFSRIEAHIYETPQTVKSDWNDDETPINDDDQPQTGFPATVNPVAGKPGPLVNTDFIVNTESRKKPPTENPATVIGRDLPGLLSAPKPPSRIKVLMDRLYTKLVSRRKIAKGQRVDLSSWEEQTRKFITSQDIPLDEFERMLNWWCDHVGEEFVVRKGIESAGGFCKNYAAVLESYESRQHDNHKKINGAVNGHVVESASDVDEIKTSTVRRELTEAERQALIQG